MIRGFGWLDGLQILHIGWSCSDLSSPTFVWIDLAPDGRTRLCTNFACVYLQLQGFYNLPSHPMLSEGWNWSIPSHLPWVIKYYLQSASTSHSPTNAVDSLSWVGCSNGNHSLQQAWQLVRSRAAPVNWAPLVWNNLISPGISCLIWRLLHRRTPTQNWARSIRVSIPSRFALCCNNEESELHLLFSCTFSISLWSWILSFIGNWVSIPSRCALCCNNEESELHLFFSCTFSISL